MLKFRLRWLLLMALALLSTVIIEAKRKKTPFARRYGKNPENFYSGLRFLGILIILIVAPVILNFCYNVYKDPASPDILSSLWREFKKRSVGYLGTRGGKGKRRKAARDGLSRKSRDDDRDQEGFNTARTENETIDDDESVYSLETVSSTGSTAHRSHKDD